MNKEPSTNTSKTLPQIAREHNVTARRVEYAVNAYQIQPASRVGIIRLFGPDEQQQIASALRRIGSRGAMRA